MMYLQRSIIILKKSDVEEYCILNTNQDIPGLAFKLLDCSIVSSQASTIEFIMDLQDLDNISPMTPWPHTVILAPGF